MVTRPANNWDSTSQRKDSLSGVYRKHSFSRGKAVFSHSIVHLCGVKSSRYVGVKRNRRDILGVQIGANENATVRDCAPWHFWRRSTSPANASGRVGWGQTTGAICVLETSAQDRTLYGGRF